MKSKIDQNKKVTNHSAQKTTVMEMKSAGIPKCDIKTSPDMLVKKV